MSKVKIGVYRLGKLLGNGAFGAVRLGVNENTNEQVAVKILNKKRLNKMKVRDKTYKEIQLSKVFNHPHVVKLHEFFETKDEIYVVFEYAQKGELFSLIADEGALEEDQACRLFKQLIFALDYIHSFGVAHRDLKPENILLDSASNIKLADFGFANLMKEGRTLNTSWGSPNYASPEVVGGKSYDGTQVDVWSWGVTLYAMLFGELPFDEENINTMFKFIKEGKYFMSGTASPAAKDLINRMLQPNPFKRITIPEILEHPWLQTVNTEEMDEWLVSNERKPVNLPSSESSPSSNDSQTWKINRWNSGNKGDSTSQRLFHDLPSLWGYLSQQRMSRSSKVSNLEKSLFPILAFLLTVW